MAPWQAAWRVRATRCFCLIGVAKWPWLIKMLLMWIYSARIDITPPSAGLVPMVIPSPPSASMDWAEIPRSGGRYWSAFGRRISALFIYKKVSPPPGSLVMPIIPPITTERKRCTRSMARAELIPQSQSAAQNLPGHQNRWSHFLNLCGKLCNVTAVIPMTCR